MKKPFIDVVAEVTEPEQFLRAYLNGRGRCSRLLVLLMLVGSSAAEIFLPISVGMLLHKD